MKKPSTTAYLLSVLLFLITYPSLFSYQNYLSSDAALADKIYIQTDGQVYTQGQTIWFKAVVVNTEHMPSMNSGVLYVDLISPTEQIVQSKIIDVTGGTGTGFFELFKNTPPGLYLVRSYTEWNKNFGEAHFFKEYIRIFPKSEGSSETELIQNVVVEKSTDSDIFKAQLLPLQLDSLHQGSLSVYLTVDGIKDSTTLKPTRDDAYMLEYDMPKESGLLSVKLTTENGENYAQTFQVGEGNIDLQFFPESGDLVDGLISKVGFKAIGPDGKGVKVEGQIVDEERNVITEFKSNDLGMGYSLIMANKNKQYYGKISKLVNNKFVDALYPLSEVKESGAVMSVTKKGAKIELRVNTVGMRSDSVVLDIESRGINYINAKVKLNEEGQLFLAVPEVELPDGVISISLKDAQGVPMAQRMLFNEVLNGRLKVTVATDKQTYAQRDRSRLKARIEDSNGDMVQANVSVMVINNNEMGMIQQSRHNLLSYMLVGSELTGHIENPAAYFREGNSNRLADLDALMLTQGWSTYNYADMQLPSAIKFQPEESLKVSGTITGGLGGNKPLEDIQLTMTTMSDPPYFDMIESDSVGRFSASLPTTYDGATMVIMKTGKKDKARSFNLNLDRNTPPTIWFDHKKEIEKVDSVVYQLLVKNQERAMIEIAFDSTARDLGEFVVEDYFLSPAREEVMRKHGKPAVFIDGDDLREKKLKWSDRFIDVIKHQYSPELFRIGLNHSNSSNRNFSGKEFEYITTSNEEATLYLIDGILVQPIDFDLVPDIPISEIKSFEIIIQPGSFAKSLLEIFPRFTQNPFKFYSYLSIYTYSGTGIIGVTKPKGIYKEEVPTFSPQREFYVPKYEVLTDEAWIRPDYRALVHWAPSQNTDVLGEIETAFYNADKLGEMMVVVEAISPDGRIGYQEYTFEVERRKR
jgi:hypothetical protein